MPLISWNAGLSLGIQDIDTQHRKLVDIINQLHDAQLQGRSREVMDKILSALYDYTQQHFSFEEKMLARAGYADLANHQQTHRAFMAKLADLQARHRDPKKPMSSLEVMNFLKDWLVKHIQGVDKRYAAELATAQQR